MKSNSQYLGLIGTGYFLFVRNLTRLYNCPVYFNNQEKHPSDIIVRAQEHILWDIFDQRVLNDL